MLPGNAQDAERALDLVEQSEAATGCAVAETLADGAYGDGETRQAFADAGRRLVAKVPAEQNGGRFTKGDFTLDLEAGTCSCPGGQQSRDFWPRPGGGGLFRFAADVCAACPLRAQCLKGHGGRSVRIHPQEGLLQAARAEQASPAGREHRTRRQVVEHRIARLVQLGIRQARYIGRTKTLFQLLMAAAVANLTLLANTGPDGTASAAVAGAVLALAGLLLTHRSRPARPGAPTWRPLRLDGGSDGAAPLPASSLPIPVRTAGSGRASSQMRLALCPCLSRHKRSSSARCAVNSGSSSTSRNLPRRGDDCRAPAFCSTIHWSVTGLPVSCRSPCSSGSCAQYRSRAGQSSRINGIIFPSLR